MRKPGCLGSSGLFGPIFLNSGAGYNFRLKSFGGATTYWDIESVSGPNYSALLDSSFILQELLPTDPKSFQLLLSSITTGKHPKH